MVRRSTYQLTALALACLMLLSSTGFSMDLHYCRDRLSGVHFFGKVKSCYERGPSSPCQSATSSCTQQTQKATRSCTDGCCANERFEVEGMDVDALSSVTIQLTDIHLDVATDGSSGMDNWLFHRPAQRQDFHRFKPPKTGKGLLILYQVFLI